MKIMQFQIGKLGVSDGTIDSLALAFKTHTHVKIYLLKSSGRTRESMPKIAEDIKTRIEKLTKKRFGYRVIGFTIVLLRL